MKKTGIEKKCLPTLCFVSAGLAGLIFIVFTLINKIAPFGDLSIIRNDALHQYVPFLADYVNKIKSGGSVLYSWTTGGDNQFAQIAYYLLSPFNLLALPFKSSNTDIAFWLIILVKTMFIGFTSCYYFRKKSEDAGLLSVAFSLIYTFSGFYMAYYYNTMWLDALIMLPLIALGIENIVNGKKVTLYFLSLAYAIFVNFYLGYMICIFSVLYFFYLLFAKDVSRNSAEKAKDELPISTVLVRYGFASLLAGLVCAVVIIPVIYAIGKTMGRATFTDNNLLFNILDFLSFHLSGVNPPILETTADTAPYAMSSILTLLTVPAFFALKNVKPNRKIATAVVLVLFYFSFAVPKMNYFWHGFSAPNGLPYRFVFIYLFFIITLAFELVKNIKEVPVWAFGISGALTAAAIVYTRFTRFASHFSTRVIIISAVAAVVYLGLLMFMKYGKKGVKTFGASLLVAAVVCELAVGNYGAVASAGKYEDYFPYSVQLEQVKKIIADESKDKVARLEVVRDGYSVYNGAALYGYNGISSFSSLDDSEFDMTQRMLGNEGNMFSKYVYSPQTPAYNAAFSINYVFDTDGSIDKNSPFYEKVSDIQGGGTLYRVKYTLPLAYLADEEIEHWDPYNYLATTVHTQLWKDISSVDDTFVADVPEQINYINCTAVNSEDVAKYIQQRQADGSLVETDDDSHGEHDHDHEHEHEHEEEQTDDGNTQKFTLNADSIAEILAVTGDMYAFKANADGFSVEFEYTAKQDGEIFALANAGTMRKLTVVRADGSSREINIYKRHISDVGYFKEGEKFKLVVSDSDRPLSAYNAEYLVTDSVQMSVASVSEQKFLEGYNEILENGVLNVTEFKDTEIVGTVNAKKEGMMVVPIPLDAGWTVYVDGEPVELHEHDSHIMMFEIPAGEHTVEMKYFPQGLKEGIFISLAAVLGIVLVLLLGKVHKMKLAFEKEEAEKIPDSIDGGKAVSADEADGNET